MITNIYPGESSSTDYVVLVLNQAQNLKYHRSRNLDLKATGLLLSIALGISEYNCVLSDCWLKSKCLISAILSLQAVLWAWSQSSTCLSATLGRCAQPISYLPYALWPSVCPPIGTLPLTPVLLQNPYRKTQEFCVWEEAGGANILQPFRMHERGTRLYSYSTKYYYGRKKKAAGLIRS